MAAAFRVQGLQGVLLNRLTQGRPCSCTQKNTQLTKLSPDGKASSGAINRILTGSSEFGVRNYSTTPEQDFDSFADDSGDWLSTNNNVGPEDGHSTDLGTGPEVGDNGQFSPDLDAMFGDFDLSSLGMTDVSCPICFGSNYVGGYSMFRGQRLVLVPLDFKTSSTLDPLSFELSAGTHYAQVTLPRGAVGVDTLRVMCGTKQVQATLTIDTIPLTSRNILPYCDGRPHLLAVILAGPMTHVEMQFALSQEPIYFEIPKLSKSQDIALLEPTEPFQIIVSPDVPTLQVMDLILESQMGKVLIVGTVNPWNTRNRAILGHEAQVRVAQPQELWNILSHRRPYPTSPKTTNMPGLAQSRTVSGFVNSQGSSF